MLKRFSHQHCEALHKFIEESKVLSSPNMRHFATSLVTNTLPLLRAGDGDSSLEGPVAELVIHTAVVLLCGHGHLLEPLQNLAFSPADMVVRPGCGFSCVLSLVACVSHGSSLCLCPS